MAELNYEDSETGTGKNGKALDVESPEFVRRLKAYDDVAFQYLIQKFKDRVFNLTLRLTRNPDDAEEVLQETFLAIFDKIDTFQGKSKLSTWIYAIAYNAALNRIKKNNSSAVTFEDETALNIDPSWLRNKSVVFNHGGETPLLQKELEDKLNQAIDTLPDGYREIFILKEIEKMSVKDIAELFHINPGAVKTRLHRARLILRAKLSDYWDREEK